jgi:hypothetical protein
MALHLRDVIAPSIASTVWAEEGLEAVRKVAKKSPETFVAIAARICPNDVRLMLEQAIPWGNEPGRLCAHARSDCSD